MYMYIDQSCIVEFLSTTYHRPGSCTPLLDSSEGHVTPPLLGTLRSLTHTWWWTRFSRSEDHCTEHHHLQTGNKWRNTGSPYNSHIPFHLISNGTPIYLIKWKSIKKYSHKPLRLEAGGRANLQVVLMTSQKSSGSLQAAGARTLKT